MLVTKTKTPENEDPLFSLLRHDLVMVSHRKYPSPVLLFLTAVKHAIKQWFYKKDPINEDLKTKTRKLRAQNRDPKTKLARKKFVLV